MLAGETVEALAEQWRRARHEAVEQVLGPTPEATPEDECLALAAEVDEAELHRRLFESGVKVGAGFGQVLRRAVASGELPALLAQLGVPCLDGGTWTQPPGAAGWRFVRGTGCCKGPAHSARCEAWREAIDGLVVGLSGAGAHADDPTS